jgi:hypothetical protein
MLYSRDAQKLVMLAMHEAKSAGNSKPRGFSGSDAILNSPEEDAETERRRDAALLRALSTPHKRQKDMKLGARKEKGAERAPCASFLDAVSEIEALVSEPGIPRDCINSFPKILNRLDKCLVVEPVIVSAPGVSNVDRMLQPSDLFLRFLTAFRAKDWPLVSIIEHEATS